MLQFRLALVCVLSFILVSCSKLLMHTTPPVALRENAKIAILPFENHTKIALAGEHAASIAAKTLSTRGFRHVIVNVSKEKSPENTFKAKLQWAKQAGAEYMLMGYVDQWNCIAWLNCKPLMDVKIKLVHVSTGHTAWTADVSKRGEPRILIGPLTEELINALLVYSFY